MSLILLAKEAQSSMVEIPESSLGGSGRNPRGTGVGVSSVTTRRGSDCGEAEELMEAVVERNKIAA